MALSNEELAKEAGVNPWELRDDLAEGNPAEIIALAQQFHAASGHAADATGIAATADEITATGYRVDNTPVHDVNAHLEQTRTQLGNSGENMELIARDLATIADELATRTTAAKGEVAALESELEQVNTAVGQLAAYAYRNPIAIDPRTDSPRDYEQEFKDLREIAIGMVRNRGGTVRDLVDGYDRILSLRLKALADMGYDPPTELDVGDPNIPPPGTDPRQVNDWWDGLAPQQQRELIAEHPREIGNLDGIPAENRNEANRSVLKSEAARIDEQIAELKGREHANPHDETVKEEIHSLEEKRKGITAIEERLKVPEGNGKQKAYLLGFDPDGNGKAIVAIGDPDTAHNVVTNVPGTGSQLSGIGTDLDRSDRIVESARRADRNETTAAIAWGGYNAPRDLGEARKDGYAENTTAALDRFQDGLRATHDAGNRSHNTVIGHSYGSTVIGHTAHDRGLDADAVVFIGSPGVGVDHVSKLGIPPERVYSSVAANDAIQTVSWAVHGRDPTDPDFGGRTFTSNPGTQGAGRWAGWNYSFDAHSEYWEPRSASLESMGKIAVGKEPR